MQRISIYLDDKSIEKIKDIKNYFKSLDPTTSAIIRAAIHDFHKVIKQKN